MKDSIKIRSTNWHYISNPSKEEIEKISQDYDLHEIIVSDLLEKNIQDKIDIYDELLFIVCHFPKYNHISKTYYLNEFKILLWKNFLIMISSTQSRKVQRLQDEMENMKIATDEKYKVSPYYLLYRFRDIMFDKVIKHMTKFNNDLINIEESIYEWELNKTTLTQIVKKKRNVAFLKHGLTPHEELLEELQEATQKLFEWELDVYFEDLITKLDKINQSISISSWNVNSLMDTYNWLLNIRTNMTIKVLTVFTVFLGLGSMISSMYGMNIELPLQNSPYSFFIVLWIIIFLMLGVYFILKYFDLI